MISESQNLRPREAARYLAIASITLAKLRMSGAGPRYTKCGRLVIYRRENLDNWLAEHEQRSTSDAAKLEVA